MFKKMQRFIFAISGSAAVLLALYLLRQHGDRKFHPIIKETLIKVDEVSGEDVSQTSVVAASPASSEKQVPLKNSTKKSATISTSAVQTDDLKRIEGIGPKTAIILNQAGITTFKALAALSPEEIKDILRSAKGRGVPTTWPQQAKLAASQNWDGLAKLQAELKGGL